MNSKLLHKSRFYTHSTHLVPKYTKKSNKKPKISGTNTVISGFFMSIKYGGEGNRTPVRRPIDRNFSHHSHFSNSLYIGKITNLYIGSLKSFLQVEASL